MLVVGAKGGFPPPSWPKPSACCWSTLRPPMRRGSTTWGRVRGIRGVPPISIHPLGLRFMLGLTQPGCRGGGRRDGTPPVSLPVLCPPQNSCQVLGSPLCPVLSRYLPPPKKKLPPCTLDAGQSPPGVPAWDGTRGCSGAQWAPCIHEGAMRGGSSNLCVCPPAAPDFTMSEWTNEKEKLGLDLLSVGDGWGREGGNEEGGEHKG